MLPEPPEPTIRPAAAAQAGRLQAEGLPPEVGGLMSLRQGGVSQAPFDSLNLRPAWLTGQPADDPVAIAENQRRFAADLEGALPVWLDQVHGARVVRLTSADVGAGAGAGAAVLQADASMTTERGLACTVLVADCLPVLLAAPGGRGVAAAHAGWRGLANGVLEASVAALCEAAGCAAYDLHAWLGACIGPERFEVGEDVREAFGASGQVHFRPGQPGKWWADLPGLARLRLQQAGLRPAAITGGQWCTASDPSRFYSFRRDRLTGRHAAAIWIR
jgi:YfiH family protein